MYTITYIILSFSDSSSLPKREQIQQNNKPIPINTHIRTSSNKSNVANSIRKANGNAPCYNIKYFMHRKKTLVPPILCLFHSLFLHPFLCFPPPLLRNSLLLPLFPLRLYTSLRRHSPLPSPYHSYLL